MMKPEKECPECGGPISWKTVRDFFGGPTINGLCSNCNIIMRGRESPEITRGKNMERFGKLGDTPVKDIGAMDKRITRLSCDTQIGILRQRQHPNGEVYGTNGGRKQ